MNAYSCSKCGASAEAHPDGVRRSCDCNASVIANMSATCYGRGTASAGMKPTAIEAFRDLGQRVVAAVRSLRRGI